MSTLGMKHIGWTPEHDAELRACMARGLSFREAGVVLTELFGIVRHRNACTGRGKRIGVTSTLTRGDGARKDRPTRKRAAPRIATAKRIQVKGARPSAPPAFDIHSLRCVPVEPLHLSLLDLEPGQCRYPFGDGPFTFCGHPQLDGRPYCGPHAALAIDPTRHYGRRRQREAAE